MNFNLVTKLQICCFNFLLYCRVADLFNQHSKYVCNSFHARRKQQLWVRFSLLQHLLLFGSQKKLTFFFFLSTAIKPEIKAATAAAAQVSSYSTLLMWYLQRGAGGHDATMGAHHPADPWARPGHKGHAELAGGAGANLLHTQTSAYQPLNASRRLALRTKSSSGGVFPKDTLGRGGGWPGLGSGTGRVEGAGAGAESCPRTGCAL